MLSSDPADLFAQLYDLLPTRLFAENEEAEGWLTNVAVRDIAAEIEHHTVLYGQVSGELLGHFVDVDAEPEEGARNRFAVLRGVDQAFQQVEFESGTTATDGLTEHVLRWVETGRVDSGAVPGAVLPKLVRPGEGHLLPEALREAFSALIRVRPQTPLPVEFEPLDDWPTRLVRDSGLRIAVMPAFGADDPFLIERVEEPVPSYRLRLLDPADADKWVAERLAALDASGAHLALLPEMALSPSLLAAWQRVCASTLVPLGGRLLAIVAGSGPDENEGRPRNQAVVVDRRSGDVILRQDKLHRFQLEQDVIERWGLAQKLGEGPLEEWCTRGQRLAVREGPGLRLAVLICEDLTELNTVGETAAGWGASVCLSPVFSQALRKFRWEEKHAGWLNQSAGVRTVVSNSLFVGDVEPDFPDPAASGLALPPTELLHCEHPLDVREVRLTEHGIVPLY